MKTPLLLLAILSSVTAFSMDKQDSDLMKRLIPFGQTSATWFSECKLSMQAEFTIDNNAKIAMKVQVFNDPKCKEGSDYITVERTGSFKYANANWGMYDDVFYGPSSYEIKPERFDLKLSPITYTENASTSFKATLVKSFLGLYQGCFGTKQEQKANGGCPHGIHLEREEVFVEVSNISFVQPFTFSGKFNKNIDVSFYLKD